MIPVSNGLPDRISKDLKKRGFKYVGAVTIYVGLQPLHDYQEKYLKEMSVDHKVQDMAFVSDSEIMAFMSRFDHILIHFDIDVLDEHFFHSTYFSNPELVGDGAGCGKMKMDKLAAVLRLITENADVVGFTVAEYLRP